MIGIRDDDILLATSGSSNPLKKFQMLHEWICEVPETLIHVPTILVTEIQEFPDAIEFIRQETAEGRMVPEIHGLEHTDYAELEHDEIVNHLEYCRGWIKKNLGCDVTRFYTPWGAGVDQRGAHIRPATEAVGLELVTCENIHKMQGRYGVIQELKDGNTLNYLEGKEIFLHWWENVTRLKRIVEVIKHGSWMEAQVANRRNDLFKEEK